MDSLREVVMSRFRSGGSGRWRKTFGTRKVRVGIALGCAVTVLLLTVAIAMGQVGGGGSSAGTAQPPPVYDPAPPSEEEDEEKESAPPSEEEEPAPLPKGWVSTHELVQRHEALPCTEPQDPINFEIFSAGPEVAGLPLNATVRRCDTAAPADEAPANRITYIYGSCEPSEGEGGCAPPLEVQTWPACQRSKAGYTFEGEPLPYRRISNHGGAEVVEFNFELESRIEVYTKSSTVVIFADSRELALQAVALLNPQEKGAPPAMNGAELRGPPPETLGAPREGATQGKLQCQP
jgi:hypothetical protein